MRVRVPLIWLLVGAVLLAGAAFRLGDLGRTPLTPSEAATALHAAEVAERGSPFWSPRSDDQTVLAPLYTNLTAGLMEMMGSSESVARLLPALAAAVLLFCPLLWAPRLGWWRTLAAVGLLAVSPTAQAVGRTAGGASVAALGLTLALLLASRREQTRSNRILIGVSLALAAASGPPFWMGLFGLALGFLLIGFGRGAEGWPGLSAFSDWRKMGEVLSAALLAFLILSSWFGTRLAGIGEGVAAAGDWMARWLEPGGWPFLTALAVIPLYELLALGGAFVALIRPRERQDPLLRVLLFWAMGALAAYLLYPGRTPADLLWFVIPAAVLAAHVVVWIVDSIVNLEVPYTALSLAGLVFALLLFANFQLEAAGSGLGLASLDRGGQIGFAATGLLFLVAVIVLFAIGWSWRETGMALGLAFSLALALGSISFAWRLTLAGPRDGHPELWRQSASTKSLGLMARTLESVAIADVGREGGLPIEVRGQAPPNLAWILRDHLPAPSFEEAGPPAVVLAPEDGEPALPSDYLGQAFGVTEHWNWVGALPPDLLTWWLDRQAPTSRERWVMYVRTDVAALGGDINPAQQD